MAIETTVFANSSISISPTGISSGNFGILGFLTKEQGVLGTAERFRKYTTLDAVNSDWGTSTEVSKAATAFYGQTPKPTNFVAVACFEEAQPATLTGGGHSLISELNALSDGALTITSDIGTVTVTGMDFGVADTLYSVAAYLEGALNSGTITVINEETGLENEVELELEIFNVTYTGTSFEIKNVATGTDSTLSFATGIEVGGKNAAEMLGLEQHQGKLSDGIAAETPLQALSVAKAKGLKVTAIDHHKDYRDQTTELAGLSTTDIATWAEANKIIYPHTSNNLSCLSSFITTDTISAMKALTLQYTMSIFSKSKAQYPGSAVFGRAASVNFAAIGSTITLNLKGIAGVTAEDLDSAEFDALQAKNGNAVVVIGDTNSVNAFTSSVMSNGSWLDTTHGLMWQDNRIEVDMFNLLFQSATKVPFDQSGINTTAGQLERSLQAGVRNGLIANGGYLADGTYLPDGYVVYSVDLAGVASSEKGSRIYSGLSFEAVGAGAMHGVNISGSFTE